VRAPQDGSVNGPVHAPDHPDYRFTLANERTLLAWLRTGLALVAGGVAVVTYAPDLGTRWGSSAVALALVLIGLGTALAGYRRWRANEEAIRTGRPLPASWLMPTVTAAVAAVVVVVAVLVGIEVLNG
jgi:putative membrane protein